MSLVNWIMKDSATLEDIRGGKWQEDLLLQELPKRMAAEEIEGFSYVNGQYVIYKNSTGE